MFRTFVILVRSDFDFECGYLVLIAPVPFHCLPVIFQLERGSRNVLEINLNLQHFPFTVKLLHIHLQMKNDVN